jgi:hypothetical protein
MRIWLEVDSIASATAPANDVKLRYRLDKFVRDRIYTRPLDCGADDGRLRIGDPPM